MSAGAIRGTDGGVEAQPARVRHNIEHVNIILERSTMGKYIDISNHRFGRLVAVELAPKSGRRTRWICKCDCGNTHSVLFDCLRNGAIKSCGCLNSEMTAERNRRHGDYGTKEYRAWRQLIGRCECPTNNQYHHYGARGITVCAAWRENYATFLADMGRAPTKKHSIDRIDNNGNYEPKNCRWATQKMQSRNRRSTVLHTYGELSFTVPEWSERTGISIPAIQKRIKAGLPMARVLSRQRQSLRPQ